MARGFGSTYGAGTSDVISAGYSTGPASHLSFAFWYFKNGTGGGGFARPLDCSGGTSNNWYLKLNSSSTAVLFIPNNSTNGLASWTDNGTGVWQHCCVTYDSTSNTNGPTVYVNGSAVGVTNSIAGGMASITSNLLVGNSVAANRNWDGMIAEVGYWNGSILTASEAKALAKGIAPLFVRPSGLSLYLPLLGTGAGEPDWGPAHVTQSLTGTARRNHAPVSMWMPAPQQKPYVAYAASLAATQGAAQTALTGKEKFLASLGAPQAASSVSIAAAGKFRAAASALTQPAASTALAGLEKFAGSLAAAVANTAQLAAFEIMPAHPGHVCVNDAAQGGLAALTDQCAFGLMPNDAALYSLQIGDSQ
jgi:hypothetical protein